MSAENAAVIATDAGPSSPDAHAISMQHSGDDRTDPKDVMSSGHARHNGLPSCGDWEDSLQSADGSSSSSDVSTIHPAEEAATEIVLETSSNLEYSRQPTCHEDWEDNYVQTETTQRLVELLGAHVELRRWVKEQFVQIHKREDILDTLTRHGIRLEARIDRLTDRRGSQERQHPEIEHLLDKLHHLLSVIRSKQSERNKLVLGANEGASTLSRKASAICSLFDKIDVEQSHRFAGFPCYFFDDLAECQYLHWRRTQLEIALEHSRKEQTMKRDEIFEAIVAVFRARQQPHQDGNVPLAIFEEGLHKLRTSDALLELDQICDNAAADLQELGPQLRQAEVRLYDTVEDYFVAKNMVDPAMLPSDDDDDELDWIWDGGEMPSTPLQDPDMPIVDEASLAAELKGRLAVVLKERYNAAVDQLDWCEERLDAIRRTENLDDSEKALAKAQDQAFFLAKQKRTRELSDAQAEYERVLRDAQDAGVSRAPAKSTGFSSQASDGYSPSIVEAHNRRTGHLDVNDWIPPHTAFETANDLDLITGRPVEMLAPSEPGTGETAAVGLLDLGESHSTVAAGKSRARIDGWLAVQKPLAREKDVSTPRRRRMSV